MAAMIQMCVTGGHNGRHQCSAPTNMSQYFTLTVTRRFIICDDNQTIRTL